MPEIFDGFVSWLAGPSGTVIIAAVIGFAGIIWQIGRQARHAVEQHRRNESIKLKLQIYQEIWVAISAASDAVSTLKADLQLKATNLRSIMQGYTTWENWQSSRNQFPDLQSKFDDAQKTVIGVVRSVEQWRVIDPRLDVFIFAFHASFHDCHEAFYREFCPLAIRLLPTTNPATGQPFHVDQPAIEVLERFATLADLQLDVLEGLSGYLLDLENEMQNLLVGELFDNKLERREPLDPRVVVVSLDRRDELRAYFEQETPWGVANAETARRVTERIAERTE